MKNIFVFVVLILSSTLSHSQIIKTSLTVNVRDELGNISSGATIKLFETEVDFQADKNAVAEGITNSTGKIKFKDLKDIPYFISVKNGEKDNVGKGEKVEKLEANKFNKVTIIIE